MGTLSFFITHTHNFIIYDYFFSGLIFLASNVGLNIHKPLAKIKVDKKSPLETKKIRQSDEYMKIVKDIYDYLHKINTEEGTPLDAAVKYFKNIESKSKTFLLDGHIPISNNICERAIKPFAIMRRNVLFTKTEKGASISSRIFTIVQTAKANALVVDKYLEYALENINIVPIEDLLPWSEKLPKELTIKQYIK